MAEPMIVKCNLSGSNQERVSLSVLGLRIKAMVGKNVDCIELIELIGNVSWDTNLRNSGNF